jgi:DNA-binding transcriptional ArsR family regulator
MAKESFILVSLEEGKTKKLARTISNETCRKILNYLSTKDYATESQISKDLGIPISTAHYNMKALQENGLVEVEEFHYSKKGREIDHYTLANKLIVIAPKEPSEKILNKLKKILPVALIVVVAAGLMKIVQLTKAPKLLATSSMQYAGDAAEEAVFQVAPMAEREGGDLAAAPIAEKAVAETAARAPEITSYFSNETILWFLIGAASAIVVFFIIDLLRKKRAKKRRRMQRRKL